jgi:hypothetical protein
VESGDRVKTRRRKSTETRILLKITIYCLKIIVRWLIDKLDTPLKSEKNLYSPFFLKKKGKENGKGCY